MLKAKFNVTFSTLPFRLSACVLLSFLCSLSHSCPRSLSLSPSLPLPIPFLSLSPLFTLSTGDDPRSTPLINLSQSCFPGTLNFETILNQRKTIYNEEEADTLRRPVPCAIPTPPTYASIIGLITPHYCCILICLPLQ